MKKLLILLLPLLLSSCAYIGAEVIGPRKVEVKRVQVSKFDVKHWDAETAIFDIDGDQSEGVTSGTNQSQHLSSPSANDIITVLGPPSDQGKNFIRYRTGRRIWRGAAIDLAIFPIPLTIPLIVPGGKRCYVDFVFDDSRTYLVEYVTSSKFYGYRADDYESGFYWGTKPGIWFDAH